jgi:chemotaxis protein MotB
MIDSTQTTPIRFIIPRGGLGGVIFWLFLTVVLAFSTMFFYLQTVISENVKRFETDEGGLLQQENAKLRMQIDRMQSEIAQTGSLLRSQELLLKQREQNLENVRTEYQRMMIAQTAFDNQAVAWEEDLQARLKPFVDRGDVEFEREKGKFLVRVYSAVLFAPADIGVKSEGLELLTQVAEVLREPARDFDLWIEGHTDNMPVLDALIRRFPTNWELSMGRAVSVLRVFQEVHGYEGGHLIAVGYGDSRPIASNITRDERAKNRRVEIIVKFKNPPNQRVNASELMPSGHSDSMPVNVGGRP